MVRMSLGMLVRSHPAGGVGLQHYAIPTNNKIYTFLSSPDIDTV